MGIEREFEKKPEVESINSPLHHAGPSADYVPPLHVVVVMDGMKEFTSEPLKWALHNIITPGSIVTLIGVMPWLNIPLGSKTWLDVWPVELENLQDKTERKCNSKYQKLQEVIDLCKSYGVVLQKKVVMGYPAKTMLVQKITSLHATWAVFDRHHQKNKEFYKDNISCNLVMMNENGEPEMYSTARCLI